MNITDILITYMGKELSIADFVNYYKNPSKFDKIELIGALVYIVSGINRIDLLNEDYDSIDDLMQVAQTNPELVNFMVLNLIYMRDLTMVPESIVTLFETDDEDEKYDLLYEFLRLIQ